jgi:hypothetical protein
LVARVTNSTGTPCASTVSRSRTCRCSAPKPAVRDRHRRIGHTRRSSPAPDWLSALRDRTRF